MIVEPRNDEAATRVGSGRRYVHALTVDNLRLSAFIIPEFLERFMTPIEVPLRGLAIIDDAIPSDWAMQVCSASSVTIAPAFWGGTGTMADDLDEMRQPHYDYWREYLQRLRRTIDPISGDSS